MKRHLFFLLILSLSVSQASAQVGQVHPYKITKGVYGGLSKPLTELPGISSEDIKHKTFQDFDGAVKSTGGILTSFEGQLQNPDYIPPDANGDVSSSYYVQAINHTLSVYTKPGELYWGPVPILQMFSGLPGTSKMFSQRGAIVLYDDQANRWFLGETSIRELYPSDVYFLIAVSSSPNPAGTWYTYSFQAGWMYAYPRFGVWRDAYYMESFGTTQSNVFAFERDRLLTGDTARMIAFNAQEPNYGITPLDNDGPFAPAGTPGLFIGMTDTAQGGTAQQIWVYGLAANWVNPENSTFGLLQKLDVPHTINTWNNGWIAQKDSRWQLSPNPEMFMNAPQYRNFGTYQSILGCYTVNMDTLVNKTYAGIQWYEFQKTGSNPWSIRQQGLYSPDSSSRWCGSIRLNGDRTIGMGYSVSGNNTYPSIRFCGQSKTAYALANSVMDYAEDTIVTGKYSQNGSNWWGSYSGLVVDPSNDKTFWYTNEYIDSANNRATRIASFRFGKYPLVTTLPASNVIAVAATLNGSINPNGLASTWHFEWGLSTSYADSSTNINAGSDSTLLPVNFTLTGLNLGVTYHYRLVGENSEGRMEGNDMIVVPGAAVVTTRAVSSIGMTSAVSGGGISTDGGSPVTERGLCRGTAVNPTVSGDHTNDGVGTGSFISQLTSLNKNIFYHVRAFATNSYGTWYGQDRTFVTLCGDYSPPLNETFNDPLLPGCWTIVDHKGNAEVWEIGQMSSADPMPALDGNYAYVDSESYGSNGIQNTDLETPVIDCSAFTSITLSFKHYFNSDPNSSAEVGYSINGGLSWMGLHTFDSTSATNPETYTISVPDVAGHPQVMFHWNYQGTFSNYWAVDDIQIEGDETNLLIVTPAIQKVNPGPASSITFNVQSNAIWSAATDQPWITVTPSGSGGGTLVANYEENLTYQSRTADIPVSIPGRPPVVVSVEQARSTVGIEERPEDHIVIYPNPTNGFISLTLSQETASDLNVTLLDVDSRLILRRELKGLKNYTLDLSNLAEGIYFMRVFSETWMICRKIILIK